MKLNFSELRGLSTYTFKSDKGIGVKILYDKDNVFNIKNMFFIVYTKDGNVLYKSNKGCFTVVEYAKTVKTGNTFFDRYTTIKAHKLVFKRNASGFSNDLNSFKEFCANRKSGNEIYNLFMQELAVMSNIFDVPEFAYSVL